jgi:hypothetical protein
VAVGILGRGFGVGRAIIGGGWRGFGRR